MCVNPLLDDSRSVCVCMFGWERWWAGYRTGWGVEGLFYDYVGETRRREDVCMFIYLILMVTMMALKSFVGEMCCICSFFCFFAGVGSCRSLLALTPFLPPPQRPPNPHGRAEPCVPTKDNLVHMHAGLPGQNVRVFPFLPPSLASARSRATHTSHGRSDGY